MRLPGGWQRRVAKVLEVFFAEAAVLLLVFPVLDEFVQHGASAVSFKLIAASWGVSLTSLVAAMLIASFLKED